MKKFLVFSAAMLSCAAFSEAGTISQVGGTFGLTSTYVNSVTAPTDVSLIKYNPYLFQSATGSTTITEPVATSTTPLSVQDTSNTAGDGSAVTFNLIGGNAAGTQNIWFNTDETGLSTMFIPVNVFGVDTVWTMLNSYVGSNVTVTFDFNSSDSLVGDTTVALNLTNGVNIRASVLCGTPGVSTGCPSGDYTGPLVGAAGSSVSTVTTGSLTGPAGNHITVSTGSINYPNSSGATNTVWNPSYNSIPTMTGGTANASAGSTGNLTLDDQAYQFGTTFANDWLVGITIAEGNTGSNASSMAHFGLSAVSVDSLSSATPEPSSIVLCALGAGLLLMGIRRRAA